MKKNNELRVIEKLYDLYLQNGAVFTVSHLDFPQIDSEEVKEILIDFGIHRKPRLIDTLLPIFKRVEKNHLDLMTPQTSLREKEYSENGKELSLIMLDDQPDSSNYEWEAHIHINNLAEAYKHLKSKYDVQVEKKGEIKLKAKPCCSYAGIEIYCPNNTDESIYAIVNGNTIRGGKGGLLKKDMIVLKRLVEARGSIVLSYDIAKLIHGGEFDELYGSYAEVDRRISKIRKIGGINIKTKRGIGRYIE
jgi:hypothetical protein